MTDFLMDSTKMNQHRTEVSARVWTLWKVGHVGHVGHGFDSGTNKFAHWKNHHGNRALALVEARGAFICDLKQRFVLLGGYIVRRLPLITLRNSSFRKFNPRSSPRIFMLCAAIPSTSN